MIDRDFLEEGNGKNREQSVERCVQVEALLDDGDEDVDRDGDPDLGFHGVLRGPEEPLDAQMLLDPLEEQLDLPAALVEGTDRGGRQGEVVGEEDQGLGRLRVVQADAPQVIGIVPACIVTVERDGLVADDAGRAIGRGRIDKGGRPCWIWRG